MTLPSQKLDAIQGFKTSLLSKHLIFSYFPIDLVFLFCCFTSQVNSYEHSGTVSLPNHTFLGKLEQAVNQYFVHILSFVTDNIQSTLIRFVEGFAIIVLQMYCYYKCSKALPDGAVGWSAVCDCGVS